MKPKIKFDDFAKLEMKVGTIEEADDKIKISLGERDFCINLKLKINKGEQIVVGIAGDKLVIPVINGNVPLSPTEKVKEGSGVS